MIYEITLEIYIVYALIPSMTSIMHEFRLLETTEFEHSASKSSSRLKMKPIDIHQRYDLRKKYEYQYIKGKKLILPRIYTKIAV